MQYKYRCKLDTAAYAENPEKKKGYYFIRALCGKRKILSRHLLIAAFVCFGIFAAAEQPDWCRHLPRPGYAKLQRVPVESEWFEVYRIEPGGIFAISEPRQYEEVISYLIVGSQRALLSDSGMGISKIRPVVEKLTSLPVIVLNSHTHPDHIGGNYEFEEVWGVRSEFTRQNTKGYTGLEMKEWVNQDHVCGDLPSDFRPDQYAVKPFQIRRFIKDAEVIELGDRKLEVIRTPGHTPDSICLIDRKNRLLFTGDTFYAGPLYLYSPETNFRQYAKSVEHLLKEANHVDTLLTAHNEPKASVAYLMALNAAVQQIQTGKVKPMDKNGLHEFFFQGFSILMKKPGK